MEILSITALGLHTEIWQRARKELIAVCSGRLKKSTSAFYPLDPQKKSAVTIRILHVVQSACPQIRMLPEAVVVFF